MDAMFQPRPHGAIAVDPLTTSPYDFQGCQLLLWPRVQGWRQASSAKPIGQEENNKSQQRTGAHSKTSAPTPKPTLQERRRVPNFFNCRRSLAASASSQSRNVTIFGSAAVAFGQMIQ